MKYEINNALPILRRDFDNDMRHIFCVQKITQYDDGRFDPYCDYIGSWDSDVYEIDKVMKDAYKREKDFCDNNITIPHTHTFILRKVAIDCSMKVIDEIKEHFGESNYKPFPCAHCGSTIQFGDNFLTDKDTERVYCCPGCFIESHNVTKHDIDDVDYKSHFVLEK